MLSGPVHIKDITGGYQFRIKPNSFLQEGRIVFASLQRKDVISGALGDVVSDVFRPGIFKRVFVDNGQFGKPYITAQAMMMEDPLVCTKYLSKKMTKDMEYMSLKRGSVLVSCAGTVGNIRLIDENLNDTVGSQDIIRVVPNDNYGFVYAYLASKPVYNYLQSKVYGSVVPRIEPENVSDIPLLTVSETVRISVDKLIRESLEHREKALFTLRNAIKSLEEWIGVELEATHSRSESVPVTKILKSLQNRLDPPAHINDGVKKMFLVQSFKKNKRLGDLDVDVYRPGIFKRCYVKDGIPYIKGSEIFLNNPFRRCEHLSRTKTPFIDEMSLHEGQILITCAGSVGSVKYITREFEDKKAIGSQDIIRVDSRDSLFTSGYLFVYLQLPFVYDFIQSMKYGSVIERIEPFHIESIPVIEPTKELSKKITDLVNIYKDYSYKAFLEEEAAVDMIEKEFERHC